MSRYKELTSGTLRLRCYNAQVGEALANVKAMDKGKVSTLPFSSTYTNRQRALLLAPTQA